MAMAETQNVENRNFVSYTIYFLSERSHCIMKMNKPRPVFHGSDLEQIEAVYGIPKEKIVQFGANVNPLGLSEHLRKELSENLDIITRYPDRDYAALRKIIAGYCSRNSRLEENLPADYIVTGNGSTELISLLISQRKARHAVVVGPTYSEYERELSLTGGRISIYHLREDQNFCFDPEDFFRVFPEDADLVILCNPNNPTSSAVPLKTLERLISGCRERGVFVMIDETYVEFAPSVEDVTAVPLILKYDNFMIIRGVSKFFAAPGLRLGYGITGNQGFLRALKLHQNPWSLNSIGAFAGELLLEDTDYIQRTRELISSERTRFLTFLRNLPSVKAYEPAANFILVRLLDPDLTSGQVFEHAIRQGLMIRDCSSFDSLDGEYIRFCIMLPEDNNRLMKCLEEQFGTGYF